MFHKYPWEIAELPFHQYAFLRAGLLDKWQRRSATSHGDQFSDAPWEAESVTTLTD